MLIFIILQEREERILNKLFQIYYIGKSDFLDRIRNKNIFIIMLLMMYISYLFFPENKSSFYYTLIYSCDGLLYRSIYNSIWLGWVATIAFISVITLIGFYFVRNSIQRERGLLIGEITASMPIKSWIFIFGKAFGNLLFLLLQMLVVILITIIMQFVRGESYSIQPIKLLIPFFILAIPACFIVAVIAIFFEIIPILRGAFGNVAYFFIWCGICIASLQIKESDLSDVFGMNSAAKIISEQIGSYFKEFKDASKFSIGTIGTLHNNIKTFVMIDANIKINLIMGRLFWIGMGIILLFLFSIFFRRSSLIRTKASSKFKDTNFIEKKEDSYKKKVILSENFETKTYANNLSMINSEIKIMLTSANLLWYAVIISCSIGVLFLNGESLNKFLIPLIWILPIFIWSKLGTIQANFNMEDYLLTYVNYRKTQLLNSIIAAIFFTILINISLIIKFLMLNNFVGIVYIFIGIFFVNSLGMFIGNIAKNSTAFEIAYIILWYVGILNGFTTFDFLGLTQNSGSEHIPIKFFAIGVILLIASITIKRNRINRWKD